MHVVTVVLLSGMEWSGVVKSSYWTVSVVP